MTKAGIKGRNNNTKTGINQHYRKWIKGLTRWCYNDNQTIRRQ